MVLKWSEEVIVLPKLCDENQNATTKQTLSRSYQTFP